MDGQRAISGSARPGVRQAELPLDGPLGLLVLRYLQTDAGPRAAGFRLPRSADVDALLGRLVLDGEDVRAELAGALARLVDGEVGDPGELTPEHYVRTAAALGHLETVADRLRAYVGAHWKEACARFGFTDAEATEPPDVPSARASQTAAAAGAQAAPERTLAHGVRSYFARRLDEEVGRSVRGLGAFSLIAVEALAPATGAGAAEQRRTASALVRAIRAGLRPYDVCASLEGPRVGVLLPGASSDCCAAVVIRIRRALVAALGEVRVAVGAASWPEHGVSAAALLSALDVALACDRRRLETGEVAFDSIPSFMVDDLGGRSERHGRLWLEGLGAELTAEVAETPGGMRLRAPLGFLRAGQSVRLGEQGQVLRGRVRGAFLGLSAPGQAPVLQLDIEPARR